MLLFALCRFAASADVAIAAMRPFPEGDRLDRFVQWQHQTMLNAAVANAHLCDDFTPISLVTIADEAAAIRRQNTGPALFNQDDEAKCIDATIRWCARRFGYRIS
jgi:hypothetical protein